MKKHLLFGAALVCALTIGSFSASARASTALTGWAWSSNIGWLSFSSTDTGAGGGAAYGVNISTTTATGGDVIGTFDGSSYAWSPNIGWVSFVPGDASSCGNGEAATVDLTTGSVTGWVRALSGGAGSGWDGCIELSGTKHVEDVSGSNGVTYHTSTDGTQGLFNGFAWDSGVIGWLDFAPGFGINGGVGFNPNNPITSGSPSVSCSPSVTTNLANPGSVTFSVLATSGGLPPYKYSWTGGNDNYNGGNSISISYSGTGAPGPDLRVKDSAGVIAAASPACGNVTIGSRPVGTGLLNLMINSGTSIPPAWSSEPSATVKKSQPFILSWNVDLSSDYSCSASTDSGLSWATSVPSSGNGSVQSGNSGALTAPSSAGQYHFTISCTSSTQGDPAVAPSSATLNVTNSSEGEI